MQTQVWRCSLPLKTVVHRRLGWRFDGGFSVIGHVENSGPEGKSTELRIDIYDPDAKTYSEYRITSTSPGGTLTRGGTVSGNTEVWPLDAAECGESGESA